jgi:aminoglycoside phosphotransferase (APT) family kinase protein
LVQGFTITFWRAFPLRAASPGPPKSDATRPWHKPKPAVVALALRRKRVWRAERCACARQHKPARRVGGTTVFRCDRFGPQRGSPTTAAQATERARPHKHEDSRTVFLLFQQLIAAPALPSYLGQEGTIIVQPYDDAATVAHYVQTLLPQAHPLRIERVAEGVSTIVYRIGSPLDTYYLRICPEAGVSLAAEVAVHQQLEALGVHVPHVLHFEPLHPVFQRSVMLTSAIPGRAIGYRQPPPMAGAIVRQAGRELARLNQIMVQGYGWVGSLAPTTSALATEYPSLAQWLRAHFTAPIEALADCEALSRADVDQLRKLLDHACTILGEEPAVLAHGDFDVTHIYYQHDSYTGMIDFGEIRGAHWLYDLGHFAIESGELLPFLLEGYEETRALGVEDMDKLKLTSLLIAARRMGRCLLRRRAVHAPDVAAVKALLAALSNH